MKNKSLYELLKILTTKALDTLVSIWETNPHYVREFDWFKQDDGSFFRQEYVRPFWSISLQSEVRESLTISDEYISFLETIQQDELLNKQANSLVGIATFQTLFDPYTLVLELTNQFLTDEAILLLDDDIFNTRYIEIEDDLYSETICTERLSPLFGFTSKLDNIVLDDDISIVKLSDKEIKFMLKAGMRLGKYYSLEDFPIYPYEHAIKITESQPKIIKSQENSEDLGFKNLTVPADTVSKVIDILRLLRSGKLYPLGTVSFNRSVFLLGTSFTHISPPENYLRNSYHLSKEDINPLISLWNSFKTISLPSNHYLSLAIRRFSQANERNNIEDKIIDYFICAEALFLSSDIENVQGELNYRLSHRSAMFIESVSSKQIATAEFMRKAYGVRSNIVHGSKIKLPNKSNGSKYSLNELSEELESILRLSIQKMVHIFESSKTNTVNWNEIIFPKTTETEI